MPAGQGQSGVQSRAAQSAVGTDFTYVSTGQGGLYVAFVIDVYALRIMGWRISRSMNTEFVLDSLAGAVCQTALARWRIDPSIGSPIPPAEAEANYYRQLASQASMLEA